MFPWGKFGKVAKRSLKVSNARINIWHGAVRSGKTITSIARWLLYVANEAPKGDLMLIGKTYRTLKRNILDVMMEMLPENSCVLYPSRGEMKLFGRRCYLVGANDAKSEGKIRGVTLAGAYGDELTLWPEDFFKMLLSRLSVQGAKFFGTTNPDSPNHWLNKEYLKKAECLSLEHFGFSLYDNPNLSGEYIAALEVEYTGVWHKRYILGEWCAAEGVVYPMFGERHIIKNCDLPKVLDACWVACDYGHTHATVFLAGGLKDGCVYIIGEYYNPNGMGHELSPRRYSQELNAFIRALPITGRLDSIYCDPSAKGFINQLREDGFPCVRGAENEVLPGIQLVASLLDGGKLKIAGSCTNLIDELHTYAWDDGAKQHGQDRPLKQNDDAVDALRYFVYSKARVIQRIL